MYSVLLCRLEIYLYIIIISISQHNIFYTIAILSLLYVAISRGYVELTIDA